MDHVEKKIQACIDGELAPAEAEAVRTHCRSCASCGRAWSQIEAVHRALADASSVKEHESLWPLVAGRMRREGRLRTDAPPARTPGRARPRPDGYRPLLQPAFALGAGIAVAAGLAVGLTLGPARTGSGADSAASTDYLADGSLLVEGVATTLDEVYLGAAYDGE